MKQSLSISANDLSIQQTIFRNPHIERPLSLIGCDNNEAFEFQNNYNNIQNNSLNNLSDNLKQSLLINFLKIILHKKI